ncbi:MAG: PPC domain-containing protein [Pirellulaceae bacterium]|jgi:hypothetical protein|nr:PPC domain-containing protein [Pirellulaceae bacterium]
MDLKRTVTFALTLIIAKAFACTVPAHGQTAYPMLMSLKPVAAQRGRSSEHTIKSRYSMFRAYQVLVSGNGVVGEIVHPELKEGETPKLQEMKVRFDVAAEALPGVRDYRIVTPNGASTLGQLVIVAEPITVETGDNNAVEKAQTVTLPRTICGAIERAEDVDVFKFTVVAGQAFSFHVRSQRLQDRIHDLQQHVDPILTLRHANGSTLAASDNYFYGDPFVHYHFEQAGEYFLQIRDARYQGNQYWEYCIEISDEPFITNVFPMGLARGQVSQLQYVGHLLGTEQGGFLSVATDAPTGPRWRGLPMGEGVTNPAPLVISDLPVFTERPSDNNTPAAGQMIAFPAGISGRIDASNDVDCYSFAAIKGERYSFEVIARREQSQLDSHVRILDAAGKQLSLNDDLKLGKRSFADSWIENWTAPADAVYAVEIRDLHLRGGDAFVYYLQGTRAKPYFELYIDTDKTQLTPGTSGVIFVRTVRKNGFDGDIQLAIEGLPAGVKADCGKILAGKGQDGCIVLEAASDAKSLAANVTIRGTATSATTTSKTGETVGVLQATALPYQETYQPGGGRGHWPVQMHTVAIGQPGDLRAVKLDATNLTLKPGDSKRIAVTIERAEGFDKNVSLDVTYNHLSSVYGNALPPGVTLDKKNSKTLLTGKTKEGHITLTAAKDAKPVQVQQICVMAHISLNFVMKTTYASGPLSVSVTE